MHIARDTTYALLDESGTGSTSSPLIVGASLIADLPATELAIERLYAVHRESPRFEGLESFERFQGEGFHHSTNPREVQEIFIDFLAHLHGYRGFFAKSDGSRMEGLTPRQRALVLYGTILPDIILSARTPALVLAFEVNEDLRASFPKLVADAVERAQAKAPARTLPTVSHTTVSKLDPHSLSITDYALAILSYWFQEGCPTDAASFAFRNYRVIRHNLALVYDFDRTLRSDRGNRTFH